MRQMKWRQTTKRWAETLKADLPTPDKGKLYLISLIQRGNISFPKATKLKNPGIVWDTRQPLLIITKFNTW